MVVESLMYSGATAALAAAAAACAAVLYIHTCVHPSLPCLSHSPIWSFIITLVLLRQRQSVQSTSCEGQQTGPSCNCCPPCLPGCAVLCLLITLHPRSKGSRVSPLVLPCTQERRALMSARWFCLTRRVDFVQGAIVG